MGYDEYCYKVESRRWRKETQLTCSMNGRCECDENWQYVKAIREACHTAEAGGLPAKPWSFNHLPR